MESKDTLISDLVTDIHEGKLQLPDFQRGWVWDDNRIKALLASITNLYPVGAAMFLNYGNDSIHFKYRTIEGCPISSSSISIYSINFQPLLFFANITCSTNFNFLTSTNWNLAIK